MQQPIQRSFTSEKMSSSAVSPCGKLLVGGSAETGCLFTWDIITGDLLRLIKGHLRKVLCIAFSSDGSLIATASDDSTCKVWSLGNLVASTQSTSTADVTFTAHTLGVNACSFLNFSDVVVTGSMDRTIKMFHSRTGVQLMTVTADVPITRICISPLDQLVVAGGQQGYLFMMTLTDPSTASKAICFPIGKDASWAPTLRKRTPVDGGHAKSICFISFLPHNHQHILVGSENGIILVWDVNSLRVVQEVASIKKGICSVVLVSQLTPTSIANLRYDNCVSLSKYPVDPLSQVGYSVPALHTTAKEGGVPSTELVPPSLPNVKYNKAKQKRLRDELAKAAEQREQLRKQEMEQQRREEEELKMWKEKTATLEQMAAKLTEKLSKLVKR
jgi:WD40 repeat protein